MSSRRTITAALVLGLSMLVSDTSDVQAQAAWPSGKTITYVVPYPAGGTTDVLARLITQRLGQALGATIIVENKPGATAIIGTEFVAKAAPDGFTLLGTSIGPMAILPNFNNKLPYDPVASFEPITMVGSIPSVLIVAGDSPHKSLGDLIAAAKLKPGALSYASGGNGTILHMSGELLKSAAAIDMVHVPYKGDTPAIQDVIGGHATAMFAPLTPITPHLKAGRLRALAVATARRIETFPDIPTLAEAGVPNAEAEQWQAIYAPKGTPREIVLRLNAEITKVLKEPDVAEKLKSLGVSTVANTPEQMLAAQRGDTEKWGRVIKAANIKID